MKKIFIVIFIFLFTFASVRIITSTYENAKRKNRVNAHASTIMQSF